MLILLIALHIILLTGFNQFYRLTTRTMKNASAQTIGLQLVGALSCLPFLPFFEFKLPSNPWTYFFLALSCVFYALNYYMLTDVRKNLEASIMGILQQFCTVMITLAGFILYGESITLFKILGIALIIAGNVLIFWQRGKIKNKKYVLTGLLAYLCNVIAGIIDIDCSGEFSIPLYTALLYAVPALFIFLKKRVRISDVKKEFKRANKRDYLITGFCWSMLYFVLLLAYTMGEVSTITPITSLSVFVNVLAGYFWFGEKDQIPRKIMAAALAIGGVILISLK